MKRLLAITAILSVAGCANWSTSNIKPTEVATPTVPKEVLVLEIGTSRPHIAVGDITVTVNKPTLFHANPTREDVNIKLQEEAATLGANAVIHVRYGKVGVSAMSYGSLEARGRAIRFTD